MATGRRSTPLVPAVVTRWDAVLEWLLDLAVAAEVSPSGIAGGATATTWRAEASRVAITHTKD